MNHTANISKSDMKELLGETQRFKPARQDEATAGITKQDLQELMYQFRSGISIQVDGREIAEAVDRYNKLKH